MNHSHGANDLTVLISAMFALFMDGSHLCGQPPDNPMFDFIDIPTFTKRTGVGLVDRSTIVRVSSFKKGLVGRAKFLWLQPKDAVNLIRPDQLVSDEVVLP